ncbi:MAG: LysR family transcriptional regulator [Oscillospiraceae bacterium]
MDIQQLRYVIEVDRTKSISKAAQNLFMGQPNLSKSIRDLEKQLGIVIFKRKATGTYTTDSGAKFIDHAKKIINQIDNLQTMFNSEKQDNLELNISIPRASYITIAFTEFLKSLKNVNELTIRFKETNSFETIKDVYEKLSHIGIIRYKSTEEEKYFNLLKKRGIEVKILREYNQRILIATYSNLAKFDVIPTHALRNATEVVFGDNSMPNSNIDEFDDDLPYEPKKRIFIYERGSQFDILRRVQNTFMWASPITEDFLEMNQLMFKDADFSRDQYKDALIYNSDYDLNRFENDFIKRVIEIK